MKIQANLPIIQPQIKENASVAELKAQTGYRVLTMEEELQELDKVYEKQVNKLERYVQEWPKQMEIAMRIERSREKCSGHDQCHVPKT